DSILSCKSKLPDDQFYTVFYEELTHNKEAELTKLCNFLNQEASPEYLKQCSNAIYDSPHKRRHSIKWTDENKTLVRSYMHSDKYKIFFAQYEF
ncbi:MAG: sulfotransferase domain-containing protein, partial [Planctomycetota bacterium]